MCKYCVRGVGQMFTSLGIMHRPSLFRFIVCSKPLSYTKFYLTFTQVYTYIINSIKPLLGGHFSILSTVLITKSTNLNLNFIVFKQGV